MQRQKGRPTHSTSQHGQVHMSDQYSGMRLSPVVSFPLASWMQGTISRTSYVVSIGDVFDSQHPSSSRRFSFKDELFRNRIDAFPFHSRYIGSSGPQPPPWLESSSLQDSNLSHAPRCTRHQVSNTMTVLLCDHAVDQTADFHTLSV